jgi:hypothetical protein
MVAAKGHDGAAQGPLKVWVCLLAQIETFALFAQFY